MKDQDGNFEVEFQPLDINRTLDALKFEFRIRTDRDLAQWLGIENVKYVSMYRHRNRITAMTWELIIFKILQSGKDPRKFLFLDSKAIAEKYGKVHKEGNRMDNEDQATEPGEVV
jgi:hypothetical protein